MAYYYDILYDKNYSNVKYKIPYLGDLLEMSGVNGNYEERSEIIGGINYTVYTGTGTPTVPDGMDIIDFLNQFKKYFNLDDIMKKYDGSSLIDPTRYYIPLKAADGFKLEIMIMFGLDGSILSNWKNSFCSINFNFYKDDNRIMNIATSDNIVWYGTYWLNDDFTCNRESYIALDVSIFDILIKCVNKNESFYSDKKTYYTHETLDHSGIEHVFINNENNYKAFPFIFNPSGYTTVDANTIIQKTPHDTGEHDTDENTKDGSGGDGGSGTGEVPRGDNIDLPTVPTKNIIGNGLIHAYKLADSELKNLSDWLWQDDIIKYLSSLFSNNPLDCIINTVLLPFTPLTGGSENITIGGKTSNVSAERVVGQFKQFDFNYGGLMSHLWGSALDYEKGLKCTLYVPFVGQVSISTNLCAYTHLTLRYIIDVISGQGIVALLSSKSSATWDNDRNDIVVDTWSFNCASTVPLARRDISGLISGAIGATASIASGNVLGVASSVMQARPSVQKSGQYNTNSGYMGGRRPYITYEFSKAVIPTNLYTTSGRPQYASVKLSTSKGFTKCVNPQIEFTNSKPTSNEINEIYNMLEQGVIV